MSNYLCPPGDLSNPLPHSRPLRHRLRHPRPRIVRRLHLLSRLHHLCLRPDLGYPVQGQTTGILSGTHLRVVEWGPDGKCFGICPLLDGCVWDSESLNGQPLLKGKVRGKEEYVKEARIPSRSARIYMKMFDQSLVWTTIGCVYFSKANERVFSVLNRS